MASSAEELVLRITGDSAGGQEALKSLEDRVNEVTTSLGKSILEGMGPMGVAAGVVAAEAVALGTALMELGQHATEVAAELEKVSLTTGIAVPALADLKFAIESTGGSLDQLNSVMFMFEQRMVNSSQKVDDGLHQIGLSLAAIDGMSHDQQILAISDAMQHAAGGTNLAAVAMDIFGRSGRTILPELMQPLTELAEKSKELGNVTEDAAKAAHDFEIAAKTMGAETELAWTKLGLAVAPTTNAIVLGWERTKLAAGNLALYLVDLGNAIGHSLDDANLATQTAAAKQDVLNRAHALGAPLTISYGDAVKYVNDKFKELHIGQDTAVTSADEWLKKTSDAAAAAMKAAAADADITEGLAKLGIVRGGDVDLTDKAAEAQKKFQAAVEGVVAGLEGETKKSAETIAAIQQVIGSHTENADVIQRVVDQIDKLFDHGVKVSDQMLVWADANRVVKGSLDNLGMFLSQVGVLVPENTQHLSDMAAVFDEAHANADNLVGSWNDFEGGMTIAGDEMNHTIIPAFSSLAREILPQMSGAIQKAGADTASFSELMMASMGKISTQLAQGLPQLFQSLESGGSVLPSVEHLASSIGSTLGKDAGGTIAKVLSVTGPVGTAIGQAIGSLAGPIIDMIANIGGPSAAELAGRKTEGAFEQQLGGIAGMGKALTDAGLSADNANAHIQALFAAEKSGSAAVQTQINAIDTIIKTHAAEAASGVQGILDAAKIVGTNFPDAMKPLVAQLEALPGLTDTEKGALANLVSTGEPTFNDLSAAAGRYGLKLDDVGGKAGQLSISTEADKIESDWNTLVTKGGADSDKVLAGMKGSLNDLVNHAMKAGDVLPTAIKPLVDQLFKTGQLTDDAGNKITDLSKLKFDDSGDPLATGMKSLTDAINHLGDLLDPKSPTGLAAKATSTAAAMAVLGKPIPAPWADWGAPPSGPGLLDGAAWGGAQEAGGVCLLTAPALNTVSCEECVF